MAQVAWRHRPRSLWFYSPDAERPLGDGWEPVFDQAAIDELRQAIDFKDRTNARLQSLLTGEEHLRRENERLAARIQALEHQLERPAVQKRINKVGVAVMDGSRLLVVRKRGTEHFILPGGKPEGEERDLETLDREVREELGCSVAAPRFLGEFSGMAAGMMDTAIVVRLYAGSLVGDPQPLSEIEEIGWVEVEGPQQLLLAPSILNQILPHLAALAAVRDSKRLPEHPPEAIALGNGLVLRRGDPRVGYWIQNAEGVPLRDLALQEEQFLLAAWNSAREMLKEGEDGKG